MVASRPDYEDIATTFWFALRQRCATLTRVGRRDRAFRLGFGALSFAAALSTASSHAQERAAIVSLDWQPPPGEGCATEQEIQQLVQRLTDRGSGSYRVVAVPTKDEQRWVATVTFVDSHGRAVGSRQVTVTEASSDCRALDEAVAIVIATFVDGLERDPPHPSTASNQRERASIGLTSFLAGSIALGPAPGVGLGLGVELPMGIPLSLDATAYLPGERLDEAGRGARFWALHGGATLCKSLFGQALSLRLCAGTQVGGIRASGTALTESRSAWGPLWLLALGPKVRFSLSRAVSLDFSIAAAWVPVRPHFHWEIQDRTVELAGGPFVAFVRFGVIGFLL
jgi:hypothetical protein